MSLAQIGLGIVGAVAGYFTGGAGWYLVGAMLMGASLGVAAGSFIDPQRADVPSPGSAQAQALDMPTIEEGTLVYDLLGTSKTVGQIFWHGLNRTVAIKEKVKTGKGGGGTEKVVVGYKYYLSWCQGICLGPIESLLTVYNGDDIVWEGEAKYTDRNASGYTAITLYEMGEMRIYFGGTDHAKITQIGGAVGASYNPSYRGYAFAFFNDVFVGQTNRAPIMRFVVKKRPAFAFNDSHKVGLYDYNVTHAMYYVINQLVGFPTTWINEQSFSDFADIMKGTREQHGISLLFSRQENAITYLQSMLTHVGAVMRYGVDGKFHLKELRDYTDKDDLPSITQDAFTKPMTFNRKSWTESLNEVAVQYAPRYDQNGPLPGNPDVYSFAFCDESTNGSYTVSSVNWAPNSTWNADWAVAQAGIQWLKSGSRWIGFMGHIGDASGFQNAAGNVVIPDGYDSDDLADVGITYFQVPYASPTGQEAINAFLANLPDGGYREGSWFIFNRDITDSNDATQLANGAAQIANLKAYLTAQGYDHNVYDHDETLHDERWLDWLFSNFDY